MAAMFRVSQKIQSSANAIIFDLFHTGEAVLSDRKISFDRLAVLPVPVRKADHMAWQFQQPLRVSTPGPDSKITEIRQYRDRIEFCVWPWAEVTVEFTQ